jgi:hypothetical protein
MVNFQNDTIIKIKFIESRILYIIYQNKHNIIVYITEYFTFKEFE